MGYKARDDQTDRLLLPRNPNILNYSDLGLLHLLSDWLSDPAFRVWFLDTLSVRERREVVTRDYLLDEAAIALLAKEDVDGLRARLVGLLGTVKKGHLHAPRSGPGTPTAANTDRPRLAGAQGGAGPHGSAWRRLRQIRHNRGLRPSLW